LFVVFPFEVEYFNERGVSSHFVGHPLLDNDIFVEHLGTIEENRKEDLIAFFPGSRKQEIKKNLLLFVDVANRIYEFNKDFVFGFSIH
jgi:lipid-A-disaccharide synthase